MRSVISIVRRTVLILTCGALGFLLGAVMIYNQVVPSGPPLQLWHTETLKEEFTTDRADEIRSFEDYQRLEDELFAQLDQQVFARVGTGPAYKLVRYSSGSAADPRRREPNWNRSFELPADAPAGGVLLLHGRSDGPYSFGRLERPSIGTVTGYSAYVSLVMGPCRRDSWLPPGRTLPPRRGSAWSTSCPRWDRARST
ncbi:MAG: hypothetical protein V3U86_09920 [Acidobacteriota bacterium]|jgi:hypothetical protein